NVARGPLRLFVFPLLLLLQTSHAVILRVGAESSHSTLASALVATETGDTILVMAGTHRESGLVIDKTIAIRGEPGAVLDAEGGGTILDIRADDVAVSGLTFRNVGMNHLRENGAIWVSGARGVRIADNRFEKVFFGVYGLQT